MPSARGPDEPNSSQGFGSITEDLRRVLRTELLRGACSATTVAGLFSMHRRTLHRHLRMEGRAFRQVADGIRFEIACELLENTDMALGQVAAALQYSELSAFTRAFLWILTTAPITQASSPGSIRKAALSKPSRRE